MPIQINLKKTSIKKPINNLVLFTDQKFSTNHIKKYISNEELSYIDDLLKISDLKKKNLSF